MVPEETQQVTDSLPKSQSKSNITQLMVPEILTASDCQETLPALREQSSEDQVCDRVMPTAPDEDVSSRVPEIFQPSVNLELPLNVEDGFIREEDNRTSHDFDAILGQVIPEELAFHFLDPSSTFDIQGSASSYQGAQCTLSPPSSSFLQQNFTTAAESGPQVEHWASRTAPLGCGVQPPNISYDGPTVNASADTSLPNNHMGQNLQIHFPSFSVIYDYQLEMLNREQGSLQKNFEETTSELKAELDRKMADIQREYDKKSQEVDTEYINQVMEEEVYRSSVVMSSLLSNGFMSKCTDRSVATGIAAVRARSTQPSTQQQQTVQRNTHMNSTPPPRPSVTTEAPIPDLSGPNTHSPRYNTTQPRPISQHTVQSDTHMNSTAPPRPSVTAADTPIPNPSGPLSPILRRNTTQPRPISPRAVVTVHPRPSVTSEALPLHSPLSNTPHPRAPPLIPNHIPSSYSAAFTPPVQGVVRAMPPHLRSSRAHNFAATDTSTTNRAPNSAAASTTNPTRLVQEQQQEKSKSGLVYLSDDEE